MPAHGPIHLPVEDGDANNVTSPKVTTRGIVYEVLRTVSTTSAFGLQVYSALCAKRFAGSHDDGKLPHRFDVMLWSALGSWQAQGVYAACFVSLTLVLDVLRRDTNEHLPILSQAAAIPASVYLILTRRQTMSRQAVSSATSALLLVIFACTAYRNIYPLATYWPFPMREPRWTTSALFASITIAAVFVPGFQPQPAPPTLIEPDASGLDKDVPQESPLSDPTPHPQLTASIFSRAFYSFMDPIVIQAFRQASTFSAKDLPPPRPSDRSKSLDARYMPVIDPISRKDHGLKNRSLWINILGAFKGPAVAMAGTMILKAVAEFLSPIALERLLT